MPSGPFHRSARPFLVLVGVEAVLGQRVVQRDQLLLGDELRVLGQMVGENVGRVTGHEAVGELAPVVVPAILGDLDIDIGVGLLELVRAGLVRRLLVGVPQPVADVAGGVAGVDGAAFESPPPRFGAATTATGGESQAEGSRADERGSQFLRILAIVGRSFRVVTSAR